MDKLDQIKQPVALEFEEFKSLFDRSLKSTNPLLDKVLTYVKKRNGKMMRPLLTLLLAKLFGKINDTTYHAALSLELLHTASLIHDDVVDESDKRRGQLSVNAVYNNKVSVLVGDYMLATSLMHSHISDNKSIVELIASLGQNLSEGEIIQLSFVDTKEFSINTYFDIIDKKTAALFRASASAGAISAGADNKTIDDVARFGEALGIAFQIKDDIFDYFESSNIGKPTGNDMREGKLTLPALFVLNKSQDESIKNIALKIREKEASDDEISLFISYIKENGGIEYAQNIMREYCSKAFDLLPKNGNPELLQALHDYVDYVIERKK